MRNMGRTYTKWGNKMGFKQLNMIFHHGPVPKSTWMSTQKSSQQKQFV